MNYYELRYKDIAWGLITRKFDSLIDALAYAPIHEYFEVWHYDRGVGARVYRKHV